MTLVSETSHKQNHGGNHKVALNEKPCHWCDPLNIKRHPAKISHNYTKLCEYLGNQPVTSLDDINGWSIQTLLRGENDSKQSDEIQARAKYAL